MKQITQKDLINLIKNKQENAIDSLKFVSQQLTTRESMFEKALKEEKYKAYIEAYEDLICYIKSKVIVPEHIEESETLLDPLCNTCGKTKEECPFQRMGSAYEDCSGFEERNTQEIRNDRFREFGNICIDAKSVDYIALNTYETGIKRIAYKIGQEKLELIHSICANEDEEEKFYKTFMEEIEWWKYWKQM